MHTLIVGSRGVGKSTLIRRILTEINRPVFGFETKKEDHLADELHGSPVYLYDAGKEHRQTPETLMGYCKNNHASAWKETFDRFAPKLLQPIPPGHIILLDELGFMETASEAFCSAVLSLLDGRTPILAAVKNKDVPFLQSVRTHANVKCFELTEDNREECYWEVLQFVKQQITVWEQENHRWNAKL